MMGLFRNSPQEKSYKTGLMLSGGGARAAYQVGVLRAFANILPKGAPNPFPVISGTSAGALNAASLATHAKRFAAGVRTLEYVWNNIESDKIYVPAAGNLLTSASSLMLSVVGASVTSNFTSLLNNAPLRRLLEDVIRLEKIQRNIDLGHLDALSITASAYGTGESVSFYQAKEGIDDWQGPHREGLRHVICFEHLLASSAIPILFPPELIGGRYFGDGVIRQLSPTSTPIKLGANRIVVIGVSSNRSQKHVASEAETEPPSLGRIAGHILNSAFVDTLENDLEYLQQSNSLLEKIPAKLRRESAIDQDVVELLEISPSQDLGELALEYYDELPKSMMRFIKPGGSGAVLSLLLFEKGYSKALQALGLRDAMAKEAEIRAFLGLPESP